MRLSCADCFANNLSVVAAGVVHNPHIARAQGWGGNLVDLGFEGFIVDRAVKDKRRIDSVVAQRYGKCHGAPISMWRTANQALALGRPNTQRSHFGLGRCFADEDQRARVDLALMLFPLGPAAAHIGAVLLLDDLRQFLKEYSERCT